MSPCWVYLHFLTRGMVAMSGGAPGVTPMRGQHSLRGAKLQLSIPSSLSLRSPTIPSPLNIACPSLPSFLPFLPLAIGYGQRCKLPQWVWGRAPAEIEFGAF